MLATSIKKEPNESKSILIVLQQYFLQKVRKCTVLNVTSQGGEQLCPVTYMHAIYSGCITLVFSRLSLQHRGSYMSAHVLLNLLNELRKRNKIRGLHSILSLFRNEFNKFNNTRTRMLYSFYHMT